MARTLMVTIKGYRHHDIKTIKHIRECFEWGLKESKDFYGEILGKHGDPDGWYHTSVRMTPAQFGLMTAYRDVNDDFMPDFKYIDVDRIEGDPLNVVDIVGRRT